MADEGDLLEIQERLRADADGTQRDALLAQLAEMHQRAADAMRRGLAPAEYRQAERQAEAAQAAARIVAAAWRAARPTST